MEPASVVSLASIVSLATVIGSLGTVGGLYYLARQVKAAENINKGANTIAIMNFLQQKEIREARYQVGMLPDSLSEFSEKDKEYASLVASSYDLAGIMCEQGYVDQKIIIDAWGPSLISTHQKLFTYLARRRGIRNPRFWIRYDNLERAAREFHHV